MSTRPSSGGSTSSSRRCPTTTSCRQSPATSSGRSTGRPTSSGSPTRCARSGKRRSDGEPRASRAHPSSTRCRTVRTFAFEAQRPAIAARGLAEAENELRGLLRAENRVVVAFPHRGEALRTRTSCGASTRACSSRVSALPRAPRLLFAVSPARRGFVWRDLRLALLPTRRSSAARAAPERRVSAARCSRSPTCAPATTSSTRTTASASCSASRRRPSPGSRATTCSSASAATTGSTSRTSRSARSRATSAPTRGSPALSKLGGKAWQQPQGPRARAGVHELGGRAARALRAPPAGRGRPYDLDERLARAARGRVPVSRDRRPADRDRRGQGGPRVAAPDGPPRLRRRRLRQDRGRDARRLHGRHRRQAGRGARRRRRCSPQQHCSTFRERFARLPGPRRDAVALPHARPRQKQVVAEARRRARSTSSSARTACCRATSVPRISACSSSTRSSASASRTRSGCKQLRPEVDVLDADRDADPAHAAHVARRPARHLDHRDAAGGSPADPHLRRRVRRATSSARRSSASCARGGQVFFVHNRVETIEQAAAQSARARARACASPSRHGQMRRARAREDDASTSATAMRRARLHDDHRERARHPARRTR